MQRDIIKKEAELFVADTKTAIPIVSDFSGFDLVSVFVQQTDRLLFPHRFILGRTKADLQKICPVVCNERPQAVPLVWKAPEFLYRVGRSA